MLDPDSGRWTLDHEPGPGPWKTWILKNLNPEEPGPLKTWETAGYGKMIKRPHIRTY